MVNGMYNEAADEFDKCLTHRLALPNRQSRGVADAHVRRAQALFYASTLEGADKVRKGPTTRLRNDNAGEHGWSLVCSHEARLVDPPGRDGVCMCEGL